MYLVYKELSSQETSNVFNKFLFVKNIPVLLPRLSINLILIFLENISNITIQLALLGISCVKKLYIFLLSTLKLNFLLHNELSILPIVQLQLHFSIAKSIRLSCFLYLV